MISLKGLRGICRRSRAWLVAVPLLIVMSVGANVSFGGTANYESQSARSILQDECAPPPFPRMVVDSQAALRLPVLAKRLKLLVDTIHVTYLAALGTVHPIYEGPTGYLYPSVERAALRAVALNPEDAGSRILYGDMKWLLAARGDGEFQRDSAEGHEAYRQLVCGRLLAQQAGDSVLLARADSLLSRIGEFVRRR